MTVMGDTLAHGLAKRSGREIGSGTEERMSQLMLESSTKPGKQTRGAQFRRALKALELVLENECLLGKYEHGAKKNHTVTYLFSEPKDDGSVPVFVMIIYARNPDPLCAPILRFTHHAIARLMQACGSTDPARCLRKMSGLMMDLISTHKPQEHGDSLVLVREGVGWMPVERNPETGWLEVKTVIPYDSLSHPLKKQLFRRCVEDNRAFLIDTRGTEAAGQVGNAPQALALGPLIDA